MNKLTMRGAAAEIKWSYHTAAALASWAMRDGVLTGQIARSDTFKLSQNPLTLAVPVKGGSWRWHLSGVQVSGTTLTATLGEKVEE